MATDSTLAATRALAEAAADKFDMNQNLIALVVAYAALGMAEHWGLARLCRPAVMAAWVLTVLVLIGMVFYTCEYCVRKWRKMGSLR